MLRSELAQLHLNRAKASMRRSQRIVLALASLGTVAIVLGIAWFTPRMSPIRPGNSAELWYQVCRAQIGAKPIEHYIGQVVLQDGWFIYEVPYMHGSWLFEVPELDAMRDFPQVLAQMDAEAEDLENQDYVTQGYRAWNDDADSHGRGVQGLIDSIDMAFTEARRENGSRDLRSYYSYVMSVRLQKAKKYWANIAFEFFFLSGLVWFVAWPIIKRRSPRRLALHWGLAPLFFMLPVYLGYATYSFTSVGPSGGVLYPWLLRPLCGGHQFKWESRMLAERLPLLLESLSQDTGEWISITGRGMWGPLEMMFFGAVIAILAYGLGRWLHGRSGPESGI